MKRHTAAALRAAAACAALLASACQPAAPPTTTTTNTQNAAPAASPSLFGFVDLGINPNVKLPAASKVGAWVPAGTITVGVGGNTWAGGDNSVPYGNTMFLPDSTVTLDGKVIIENGQLRI